MEKLSSVLIREHKKRLQELNNDARDLEDQILEMRNKEINYDEFLRVLGLLSGTVSAAASTARLIATMEANEKGLPF